MHSLKIMVALPLLSAGLAGCQITKGKHNDVLIFGTSTKVALDVSAPVQNAGIPEFTIGYKRQEAVWMPLRPSDSTASGSAQASTQLVIRLNACMANLQGGLTNDQRAKVCLATVLPGDKYVSISSGINSAKGGQEVEIDTYSVFASFGAKGSLSFNAANGGLAQFFATGVAAQRLGANPTVGVALSATAGSAVAEIAKADTAKAQDPVSVLEGAGNLSRAQAQQLYDAAKQSDAQKEAKRAEVRACLADATKLANLKADPVVGAEAIALGSEPDAYFQVIKTDGASKWAKTLTICGIQP